MKRLLITICFLCLSWPVLAKTPHVNLLNAVTTTGAGTTWSFMSSRDQDTHPAPTVHTVSCRYVDANASVSAVTVVLQGTNEDSTTADADATWINVYTYNFSAGDITALNAIFSQPNVALRRVRLNLTTFTGADGTNDKLTCDYEAGQ